jgi:tetratricopeptide (TPR) repeat protein
MIIHDLKYNGDIKAWTKYNPLAKLIQKEHHILELAYNSLDKKKQALISKLSAFRNPMDYDAVSIFNDFGDEERFGDILNELVDRGMLFRNEKSNKFDIHPIVRKYCYDRLWDREGVHSKLRDHFTVIPVPKKSESVDDLTSVIELYHHTVMAGKYYEAAELFRERLAKQLYYRFGAYQKIIELIRALFPDGEDKLPRLKDESAQAWILNSLANSYGHSGQPRGSVPLFEMQIAIREKQGVKKSVAIGLGNLASVSQIIIGEFDAAESNTRRKIEICREIKEEFEEADGHLELGRLLAYRGKFAESETELIIAFELFTKRNAIQAQGAVWAFRSLRALLMSRAVKALGHARKARERADDKKNEIDIIRAEWLLGAAHLMKGSITNAENT